MLYDYFSVNRQGTASGALKYLWRKVRSSRPEDVKGEPRCIETVFTISVMTGKIGDRVYQEEKE